MDSVDHFGSIPDNINVLELVSFQLAMLLGPQASAELMLTRASRREPRPPRTRRGFFV